MFNRELIGRYDLSGPRYTSYPSALEFHEQFGMDQYQRLTESTNEELVPRPLSLYVHLPFCNTVCYYCACNKIITANRERARPYLEDLHREIAMQGNLFDKDRVVKQMHWGGGTPTFISNEQTITLMQKLWQHFKLLNDDSGEYSIEIDPRQIKPESIGLLRTLGFNRLSLGVQDFDPAVQQAVNRNQSYEQTLFSFEEARKHGFHSVNMDLIYGLPRQTVDTFSDTIDKVINLSPERIAIYNYAHLPHVFKVQKQINENELPDAETKLQILERAIRTLTDAGYVYIGMDHFAKPDDELAVAQREGHLYRNFQGYSTNANCDVVGLGVTSISKIGNSYSQNYRTLEDYHAAITQGRIPVFRGYQLDFDDELRREVISQLICHFNVYFTEIEKLFHIDFRGYFDDELCRLTGMVDDELLFIDAEKIRVLPAGRFFIRNICSVFDRYMNKETSTRRFSRMI